MSKRPFLFHSIGLVFLMLLTFPGQSKAAPNKYNIIPYPQKLVPAGGKFAFDAKTSVFYQGTEAKHLAEQFVQHFNLVSGFHLKAKSGSNMARTNAILFQTINRTDRGVEAYNLNITGQNIIIKASAGNGFFYALQSLYQLLPADIYQNKQSANSHWEVACAAISDAPRFSYRGLHLDVCRHFYPISFIKKYIDAMAIHKLNTFHWHLTDDQGWRIEIKKYPLLTEVGSKRSETLKGYYFDNYPQEFDGQPHSGFYTQDEAREIVAYAKERYITVIPEIELPGHAQAAVAAYPFLSCRQDPAVKPATSWGVFTEVYCPREKTFAFLEDVLTEVMAIFPGKYIHIGGDECPKDNWKKCPDCQALIKKLNLKNEDELQSYFVERMEKFINSKNKQIIGWDEILDGGLAPNATVMSWRGTQGGIAAAKSGHDVIMTPGSHCYFDQYQDNPVYEPTTIGGLLPIKKVYSYEPVPTELTPEEAKHVLGAQANVWSEYLPTTRSVEYMAFPRVSAMAEVLWDTPENRNWESFRNRMLSDFDRYTALDIQAGHAFFNVHYQSGINTNKDLVVEMECDRPDVEIHYNTIGKQPDVNDPLYTKPLILSQSAAFTAAAFINGQMIGKPTTSDSYIVSKLTGLSYTKNVENAWYDGGATNALTDGRPGNTKVAVQWVGLGKGKDCEIIFDCTKGPDFTKVSKFSIGMLHSTALGVELSTGVKIYGSKDGKQYTALAETTIEPSKASFWEIRRPVIEFKPTEIKFLKVVINKAIDSPLDSPKTGLSSHLFVDEISLW